MLTKNILLCDNIINKTRINSKISKTKDYHLSFFIHLLLFSSLFFYKKSTFANNLYLPCIESTITNQDIAKKHSLLQHSKNDKILFHVDSINSILHRIYNSTSIKTKDVDELLAIRNQAVEYSWHEYTILSSLLLAHNYKLENNFTEQQRQLEFAKGYLPFVANPIYNANVLINLNQFYTENRHDKKAEKELISLKKLYLNTPNLPEPPTEVLNRLKPLLNEKSTQESYYFSYIIIALLSSGMFCIYKTRNKNKSYFKKTEKPQEEQKIVKMVDNLILTKEGKSLKQLSKHTSISEEELKNSIEKVYNCSFKIYRKRKMVEYAKSLLLDPETVNTYSIETIGQMAGFKSRSTFYQYFKEQTTLTPTQFIQNNLIAQHDEE